MKKLPMPQKSQYYYTASCKTDRTDYLADLMLWRNDPDLAGYVETRARAGDINAQYAMGLIHAEGRGVTEDQVMAYAWLTVAAECGDQDARLLRTIVASNMSSKQIDEGDIQAQKLQAALNSTENQH